LKETRRLIEESNSEKWRRKIKIVRNRKKKNIKENNVMKEKTASVV
jgi:hypothetical protein